MCMVQAYEVGTRFTPVHTHTEHVSVAAACCIRGNTRRSVRGCVHGGVHGGVITIFPHRVPYVGRRAPICYTLHPALTLHDH